MFTETEMQAIAAKLTKETRGVRSARLQGGVIVIELTSKNGGRGWNGGIGGQAQVDASGAFKYLGGWAGSATRKYHKDENDTENEVVLTVQEYVEAARHTEQA